MAQMNLATTMDAIASALVSAGCVTRATGWPTVNVQKGQAAVGYPERVEFDVTFARGLERATFPVWVVCGLPGEESTRNTVSALITGATDVKDALDGTLSGSVSSLRVIDCRIESYEAVGGAFVAVRFDCDVLA